MFGLYLATLGNDDVQTPVYPERVESQLDYDADDEASTSLSPFSELTDPGCEDEDQDTSGDYENLFLKKISLLPLWFTRALSLNPLASLIPTDDYDTHPSNQAKAENQQDQHVEKGKKIESLFTNDGEAKLKPICISSLV